MAAEQNTHLHQRDILPGVAQRLEQLAAVDAAFSAQLIPARLLPDQVQRTARSPLPAQDARRAEGPHPVVVVLDAERSEGIGDLVCAVGQRRDRAGPALTVDMEILPAGTRQLTVLPVEARRDERLRIQ